MQPVVYELTTIIILECSLLGTPAVGHELLYVCVCVCAVAWPGGGGGGGWGGGGGVGGGGGEWGGGHILQLETTIN